MDYTSENAISINDVLKYVLKMMLFFDTSNVHLNCSENTYNLQGGSREDGENAEDLLTKKSLIDQQTSENEADRIVPSKEQKKFEEKKKKKLFVVEVLEEITLAFMSGINFIKDKVKAILLFFVYISIFPVIPFFIVMASLFGVLKYMFFKVRIF